MGRRRALFLQERFEQAEIVNQQRQTGKLSTLEYGDDDLSAKSKYAGNYFTEFESRCCVLFMRTFPEEAKRPILEYSSRAVVTSQKMTGVNA